MDSQLFLEDWLTKTIAFVITLALWYGVTGTRVPTTRRLGNVRLVLQLPPETDTTSDLQNKVDVTVTGDKTKVAKLTADDLIVTADLTNSKPEGDLVVQLRPDSVNLDLPAGVKLDAIEPSLTISKAYRSTPSRRRISISKNRATAQTRPCCINKTVSANCSTTASATFA